MQFFRFMPKIMNLTKKTIADYQALTKKMQKKCNNIWSCQKKAVILQSLSL